MGRRKDVPEIDAAHEPLQVAIEGGVGVGKSTVIRELGRRLHGRCGDAEDGSCPPRVMTYEEPVDLWRARGLLRSMYDGTLSPLGFQMVALTTRIGPLVEGLRQSPSTETHITERSIFSDKEIFARTTLNSNEWDAYALAHQEITRTLPRDLRVVTVQLDLGDNATIRRIRARGRPEEVKTFDRSRVRHMRLAHNHMYALLRHDKYRVDASRPLEQVCDDVMRIVEKYSSAPRSPTTTGEQMVG